MLNEWLTPREREILHLVSRGLTNKEIAKAFGSSPNTVRNQLNTLYRKVGVVNRTALALSAVSASQGCEAAGAALMARPEAAHASGGKVHLPC